MSRRTVHYRSLPRYSQYPQGPPKLHQWKMPQIVESTRSRGASLMSSSSSVPFCCWYACAVAQNRQAENTTTATSVACQARSAVPSARGNRFRAALCKPTKFLLSSVNDAEGIPTSNQQENSSLCSQVNTTAVPQIDAKKMPQSRKLEPLARC